MLTPADGVRRFLDDYVRLKSGEQVLIVYTSDSQEALVMLCVELHLRRTGHVRTWMHPIHDANLGSRLDAALAELAAEKDGAAGGLVVVTMECETFSHSELIAARMEAAGRGRARLFRMISARPELFATALLATPGELTARNARLLHALIPHDRLRITTSSGTSLEIGLDSRRHRWISNRGASRFGRAVILPAGEVATYPQTVSGRFVADFAYNMNCHTDVDARLGDNPVTLDIVDGRVVHFTCASAAMSALVRQVLAEPNGDRIGELGLGTNPFIREALSANSHINERRCGVNLGLGQHNQDGAVVDYYCPMHLDLIASDGLIHDAGGALLCDLANLADEGSDHDFGEGLRIDDEDVFAPGEVRIEEEADCCGGGACGLLQAGKGPVSA
ncbi:MAG: hypothetical protein ACKO01_04870 [Erythrobacter sp.]